MRQACQRCTSASWGTATAARLRKCPVRVIPKAAGASSSTFSFASAPSPFAASAGTRPCPCVHPILMEASPAQDLESTLETPHASLALSPPHRIRSVPKLVLLHKFEDAADSKSRSGSRVTRAASAHSDLGRLRANIFRHADGTQLSNGFFIAGPARPSLRELPHEPSRKCYVTTIQRWVRGGEERHPRIDDGAAGQRCGLLAGKACGCDALILHNARTVLPCTSCRGTWTYLERNGPSRGALVALLHAAAGSRGNRCVPVSKPRPLQPYPRAVRTPCLAKTRERVAAACIAGAQLSDMLPWHSGRSRSPVLPDSFGRFCAGRCCGARISAAREAPSPVAFDSLPVRLTHLRGAEMPVKSSEDGCAEKGT